MKQYSHMTPRMVQTWRNDSTGEAETRIDLNGASSLHSWLRDFSQEVEGQVSKSQLANMQASQEIHHLKEQVQGLQELMKIVSFVREYHPEAVQAYHTWSGTNKRFDEAQGGGHGVAQASAA